MCSNCFPTLSKNRNGSITASELIKVYRDQGRNVDERVLRERLGRMDKNADDTVSFAEFVTILEREKSCLKLKREMKQAGLVNVHRDMNATNTDMLGKIDVSGWTVEQVAGWLARVGHEKHCLQFVDHGVDGSILLTLSEADLNTIGIKKLGESRDIARKIRELAMSRVVARHRGAIHQMKLKTNVIRNLATPKFSSSENISSSTQVKPFNEESNGGSASPDHV